MLKKKIAFVVQRYGREVNGGAELLCRQMAEHMTERYEVEVLTTKAIDYITWKNEYPSDQEELNGVLIRRFPVSKTRNSKKFDALSARVFTHQSTPEENQQWMEWQGPYCPALLDFIQEHQANYQVFIFFTYLYYTTYMGLPLVREKAILLPTAHDEPPIYVPIFRDFFHLPKGIFYNTPEEKALVERLFHNGEILNNQGMGGAGIETPAHPQPEIFREQHDLERYLIYVGRIDKSKGCAQLFQYFEEYKRRNPGTLKLVLMGKPVMEIPSHPDILPLGFVTDEEKYNGMAGAEALVLPSRFESLSLVVLESMSLGVPVVVNGKCDVLKEHCIRSNAGLYYRDYFEFEGTLNYLLNRTELRKQMGELGVEYVEKNYRWDKIVDRLSQMVEMVGESV